MPLPINDYSALDVYHPRNPSASDYYKCVESHFEELAQVWDDRYAHRFGFWRPYVMDVIHRYLDCGDLRCGFARVKCEGCGMRKKAGTDHAIPAIAENETTPKQWRQNLSSLDPENRGRSPSMAQMPWGNAHNRFHR